MREYVIQFKDRSRPDQVLMADYWDPEGDEYAFYSTSNAGVAERRTVRADEVLVVDPASGRWGQAEGV